MQLKLLEICKIMYVYYTRNQEIKYKNILWYLCQTIKKPTTCSVFPFPILIIFNYTDSSKTHLGKIYICFSSATHYSVQTIHPSQQLKGEMV